MEEKILRLADVSRLTSLSESTIKRAVKAGTFPKPHMISSRAKGWIKSEVADWMERCVVAGPNTKAKAAQPGGVTDV